MSVCVWGLVASSICSQIEFVDWLLFLVVGMCISWRVQMVGLEISLVLYC